MDDEELLVGYFQEDGSTTHPTRETLQYIRECFNDRIIRNTEIPYPSRSCYCFSLAIPFIQPGRTKKSRNKIRKD